MVDVMHSDANTAPPRVLLRAKDFGLADLASGGDATPVFRRALEACRREKAGGLQLPAGTWHLYPDRAFEQYLVVANNDSGLRRVVFLLDGLDDFSLVGEGTQLVCHGEMVPVSAEGCRRLTLRGFSIDWETPFHLEGKVTGIHPELHAFDLDLSREVHYELRGSRLVFRGRPSPSSETWRDWAPQPGEHVTWEQNLQWNVWFDGKTRRPVPNEGAWALEPDPRVEELAPGRIRVFDALRQLPEPGMVLAVNGMMERNRTSPAIRVSHATDLLVEDVTVHHAGGMGLVVQRTENATLRRYAVTLPEGRGRHVTTTADATHFNGCRGKIVVEDGTFEHMLDDATNVHGCFVRIDDRLGARTVLCRRMHSQQAGLVVAEKGDRVRFVTSADLQPCGDATVVATRELNATLFEVTLDALPEGDLRAATSLYNLSWQPELEVRGCTVRNNRGRSILVATAGRVVIEDNLFQCTSMSGIQFEGDNSFWWESGPVRDVTIRKNRFVDVYGPVVSVIAQVDPVAFPDALYHGGIVFEDNLVETFHRRVVQGPALDGLVFRGNRLRVTATLEDPDPDAPAFALDSGRNTVVEGNRFEGVPPLTVRAGTDAATPVMRDNEGIVMEDRW
jgi:hypothetical protein